MCYECYTREYGKPGIVNGVTIAAARAIDNVYHCDASGGDAHIVIDDWNLDDGNIRWCIEHADHEDDETREAALACLHMLLRLTVEERASALAISEGFIETGKE